MRFKETLKDSVCYGKGNGLGVRSIRESGRLLTSCDDLGGSQELREVTAGRRTFLSKSMSKEAEGLFPS